MNRIEFIWLDQLTFEEMKQRVAELPPNSAILYAVLSSMLREFRVR